MRKMMDLFFLFGTAFILTILLTACQDNGVTVEGDTLTRNITADVTAVPGSPSLSVNSQWPKALPAELPVLDAPVETVMVSGTHARIFYSAVSEEVFLTYLGRLKAAGCELRAVVYHSNPDSDENAKKRAARGEYDAIYTRLGHLDLRLEVSWNGKQGRVTYDIDGLDQETAAAVGAPEWPANWAGLVPKPQGCVLIRPSIMEAGETRLMVVCSSLEKSEEKRLAIYRDYIQVLLNLGYQTKTALANVNLLTPITLTRAAVTIDLDPNAGGLLMISAKK